jgi:hypothetical protein
VIALCEVAMSVQALILKADFAHWVNSNGTVDSICLHCFGTVASLTKEIDLEQQEAAHACWQLVESTEMKSAAAQHESVRDIEKRWKEPTVRYETRPPFG